MTKGIAIRSIFPPNEDGHVEAVRYGIGSSFWKIPVVPMVYCKSVFIRILKFLKQLIFHPVNWIGMYFTKNHSQKTVILLFMQHLDSTINFKRGWFNLRSNVSSGLNLHLLYPWQKLLPMKLQKQLMEMLL
ncbi:MAG: hypothetical protein L3J34_06570 [Flavobacteriaceae bacterium]|nr:hypothetical protein [Flavobacteriaceae bacterium]